MKVFFFPNYLITNPYQKLLYSNLGGDIEVAPSEIDDVIRFKEQNLDENVVFHLHWQNVITGPATSSHEHRLLAKQFIKKVYYFKSLGGKVFWTIHNKLPHDVKYKLSEIEFHTALGKAVDRIILHDISAYDIVNSEYPINLDKVRLIPHGHYIDAYPNNVSMETARNELGISESNFVASFVGQLRPYKGLDLFIEAALYCSQSEKFNAVIAGKPVWPYHVGHVTQMCSPIKKIKVYEGYIEDEQLQFYLNASDVVVLPYRDILTSGSVILAASFAKPIILPDISAFSSIKDKSFVFTYDPSSMDALVSTINSVSQLSKNELQDLGMDAFNYAKSLCWDAISNKLSLEFSSSFNSKAKVKVFKQRNISNSVKVYHSPESDISQLMALLIVNYKSYNQICDLLNSMPLHYQENYQIYILDNSCDSTELQKLLNLGQNITVVEPDKNLGYAAGNNILIQLAIDNGSKSMAILNPDMIVNQSALKYLHKQTVEKPLAIHSALILKDSSTVSFHTASLDKTSPLVKISHPFDGTDKSLVPNTVSESDLLNGCALFFSKQVIEKCGLIPEEYFLYFEETDWTISAKNKGCSLLVHSNVSLMHNKASQSGGLPTLAYTYYLLRSSILFAIKFKFDAKLTEQKYRSTFVEPWIQKISKKAPSFVNCFKTLCDIAFQDGHKKVSGQVDIINKLSNAVGSATDSNGFLEYATSGEIGGWAGQNEKVYGSDVDLIFISNNEFIGQTLTKIERPDVQAAGYNSKAGFVFSHNQGEQPSLVALNAKTLKPLQTTPEFDAKLFISSYDSSRYEIRPSELIGRIDGFVDGRLRGWAADVNNTNVYLDLDLYIDEIHVKTIKADLFREDLKKNNIGDGNASFSVLIDPAHIKSDSKMELKLQGSSKTFVERKVTHHIDLKGFDSDLSLDDFLRWSYTNVITPYGAFELEGSLRKELNFVKSALVAEAKYNNSQYQPLITIVMPAFNREKTIKMAINSVLQQTYKNYELIVVDDGSDDATCEIVENIIEEAKHVKLRLLKATENGGVSKARNIGLSSSTGDIISYLDSDNEWEENYLSLIASAYHKEPEACCAYAGQEIWFQDDIDKFRTGIRMVPFNRAKLENSNYIDLNVFSHKRNILDKLGSFREDMRRLVDWELILRYTKNRRPIFIPALMNKYYFGFAENQITSIESYESNLNKLLRGENKNA